MILLNGYTTEALTVSFLSNGISYENSIKVCEYKEYILRTWHICFKLNFFKEYFMFS